MNWEVIIPCIVAYFAIATWVAIGVCAESGSDISYAVATGIFWLPIAIIRVSKSTIWAFLDAFKS